MHAYYFHEVKMGPGLRTSLLLILCVICATAFAQTCTDPVTNCGQFCCSGNTNLTACCSRSKQCCLPDSDNEPTTCDESVCPTSLSADQFYDSNENPQLRNKCCMYFRSGCCSDAENASLDLLFKLAIGLSIGLFGLLLIICLLIACCCCCMCYG